LKKKKKRLKGKKPFRVKFHRHFLTLKTLFWLSANGFLDDWQKLHWSMRGKKNKKNCPMCGGSAESKGKKKRQLVSPLGELRVKRRVYKCKDCNHYFYPLDYHLEIARSSASKRFAKISAMMSETLVIQVSRTFLSQIAHRIGSKFYQQAQQN